MSLQDFSSPTVQEKPSMPVSFWLQDPNVLLDPTFAWQWFPEDSLSLEAKLNALTRLVFVMTLFGFMLTQNMWVLASGAISIIVIAVFYTLSNENTSRNGDEDAKQRGVLGARGKRGAQGGNQNNDDEREGFETHDNGADIPTNAADIFDVPQSNNPMSNVLLTDYQTNPQKRPAPPCILTNDQTNLVTSAIQKMNPTNPYLDERLFMGTGDRLEFDQSMRSFYSTPSTTIPNDQQGFADFCYGGMVSCKEGNKFACARNLVNPQMI